MNATTGVAADRLRSFIERIERLEDEKAAIAADIREVKAEAKASGFDVKTINEIIRLRKMDPATREEHEALLDIYKGALGMLYDTPLGEAARRRLAGQPPRPQSAPEDTPLPFEQPRPDPEPEPEEPPKEASIEDARAMGTAAAKSGKPVTANPFPARDPRRAAWDEEWCRAAGNDGMEIPEAWQRKKPAKPKPGPGGNDGKPDNDQDGGSDDDTPDEDAA